MNEIKPNEAGRSAPESLREQEKVASAPAPARQSAESARLKLLWSQWMASGLHGSDGEVERMAAITRLTKYLVLPYDSGHGSRKWEAGGTAFETLWHGWWRRAEELPEPDVSAEQRAEKQTIRLILRILTTVGSHKAFGMALGAKQSTLYSYSDVTRPNRPGRARLQQAAEYLELQSQTLRELAAKVRGIAENSLPSASNRTDSTPALLLEPDLRHPTAHD